MLFADAGNAWAGVWDWRSNDLRANLGAGARIDSPLGPLLVDAGYQLTPIPGLRVNDDRENRRWRVHVGIGYGF